MQTTKNSSKLRLFSVFAAAAGLALAGCAAEDGPEEETQDPGDSVEIGGEGVQPDDRQDPYATADLMDADDTAVGHVEFYDRDGQTEVIAVAEDFDPGFYGFHLHAIGECEPDSADPDDPENTGDFMSAGGHLPADDAEDHPDHAGDMPVLLVNEDGTATMAFRTDRVDESLLMDDDDGTAVMVHSDPDNYAQVPERYLDDENPDQDTLDTGDAGDRLACGVIGG